jgi:hypothetical protein
MGCATGEVLVDAPGNNVVGVAITRAVRLESASDRGSLLVDVPTFDALPAHVQEDYGSEIVVTGKRDERFAARRCTFVELPDTAGEDAAPVPSSKSVLSDAWNFLDENLQDAFALAYNKKRRERAEQPTRISTRDLFQALDRINDESLQDLLDALPSAALPESSDLPVTNEPWLLKKGHLLSSCVSKSLDAFVRIASPERKIAPVDIFVDISKHGHGPSVRLLRSEGIGPEEIESRVSSLGIELLEPRDD